MTSKLHQVQAKAFQVSQFVAKNGTAYYKQLLEQNKQNIVEKCNELSKQLFYMTRLARESGYTLGASVAFGARVGIGSAYTQCSHKFDGSLPKLTPSLSDSPPPKPFPPKLVLRKKRAKH